MQLASFNISTLLAPIDHPTIAEFTNNLDHINALGDASDGFVWRYHDASGNATAARPYPDARVITNLVVFRDRNSLRDFTYRTEHSSFLRQRRQWFDKMDSPVLALWWIPEGHIPTLNEGRARLDHVRMFGSTQFGFGWRDEVEPIVVERRALDHPDVIDLIGELNTELRGRYPEPGANHFTLTDADVAPGNGAFIVAYQSSRAVACGAVRRIDEQTAELKRMYTRPAAQGFGIGKGMTQHLIGVARDLDVSRLVLETGIRQPESIAVYQRLGFRPMPCWGEYANSPDTSACFALDL